MTDALQPQYQDQVESWHQNLTKGTLAEAICARHFSAAGWYVSQTGIERLIPDFARRDREQDKSNALRIQKYIGLFPDLLVHHPDPACNHHYLIEVKFRKNVTTPENLDKFVIEMLWQYKNFLFSDYDKTLFPSLAPDE